MGTELIFVTGDRKIFTEVEDFFKRHAPEIQLIHKSPQWHELQSLDERKVIEYKIIKAWRHYQQPLLVEDSGFYFKRYPSYPGTLSEFALSGLARGGLNKLCRVNNEAMAFSWVGFITQSNADCYFNDTSEGYIMDDAAPIEQGNIDLYTVFHPEGAPRTLEEMSGNTQLDTFSPRLKAFDKFLKWYRTNEEGI